MTPNPSFSEIHRNKKQLSSAAGALPLEISAGKFLFTAKAALNCIRADAALFLYPLFGCRFRRETNSNFPVGPSHDGDVEA